ncbi:hypothetical protein [Streptomyces sp. NPDC058625]|uniref:hypothetical protein n=1 Tax=Streptomyces sp. NPDC058625 TaxID=3346564 RepID=UPI00365FC024
MKYIGLTSQNSSPDAVSGPVTLSAGYRPVIAAATGVPLRGSLSRASTHVTTVFGFVISTLAQALGTSSSALCRPVGKGTAPASAPGKTARRPRRLLETERARHRALRDDLPSPSPDSAWRLSPPVETEDGVGMFGMYSFRHHFAPNALGNGIPITDVAVWTGRKSIEEAYRTYRHLMPGSITKTVRVLDAGLWEPAWSDVEVSRCFVCWWYTPYVTLTRGNGLL